LRFDSPLAKRRLIVKDPRQATIRHMTPPPPEDPGLPQRHRLSTEKLRKESLESELWNLDDDDIPMPVHAPKPVPAPAPAPTPAPGSETPHPHPAPAPAPDHIPDEDFDTPLAGSHSLENRRKYSFSRNDIIAVSSVALLLVMVAIFFLINALSGLPRITDPHQKPNLPAKGAHFTVSAVESYWRVPITTGPDADTVQRDTELMPVLEITVSGSDAALRIQFFNSDGAAVGDPITHTIRGETKLVIPSTAGLEDINVHNAYRTNLINPWRVEILEASAGTTAGNAFRSLITVPISPDRR